MRWQWDRVYVYTWGGSHRHGAGFLHSGNFALVADFSSNRSSGSGDPAHQGDFLLERSDSRDRDRDSVWGTDTARATPPGYNIFPVHCGHSNGNGISGRRRSVSGGALVDYVRSSGDGEPPPLASIFIRYMRTTTPPHSHISIHFHNGVLLLLLLLLLWWLQLSRG